MDVVSKAGVLFAYGLNGGAYQIEGTQDLWSLIKTHGVASSFYMYMLVPLVDGAPYFPVWVYANDGSGKTLDAAQVKAGPRLPRLFKTQVSC